MIYTSNIRLLLGLLSLELDPVAIAISGSSVLRYYQGLDDPQHIGDIDIFVHLRPRFLENFLWYGGARSQIGSYLENNNSIVILHKVLCRLMDYNIGHSNYREVNTSPATNPDDFGQYNWLRVEYGIVSFISFKLHPLNDTSEEAKTPTLQFMFVNDYPPTTDLPFCHRLLSGFDINVCQLYIHPTMNHARENSPPYEVKFLDRFTLGHIAANTMTFTFRKCQPFEVAFRRLRKYQHRGFQLVRVSFDEGIPSALQEILIEYSNAACRVPLLRSFLHSPLGQFRGASDIVKTHISGHFALPDDIQQREKDIHRELLIERAQEREREVNQLLPRHDDDEQVHVNFMDID